MGLIPGSDSNQARLTIEAYEKIDCTGPVKSTFICQSNPEKLAYTFKIDKGGGEGGEESKGSLGGGDSAAGNSAAPPVFKGYTEMTLKFDIIADATGIVPVPDGMEGMFGTDDAPSIKPYLDLLQNTLYSYQKESHGPPYLKMIWGNVFPDSSGADGEKKPAVYKGMLNHYDVEIELFSISGEPIKAKISIEIDSLIDPAAKPLGNSPDLTHNIPIQYGDKMTMHCNKIYGRYDSKICAAVAQYNTLIDWDLDGMTGKTLIFPSIHLLNELYLHDWEELERKNKEKNAGKVKSHFDFVQLVGQKKANQYFKVFGGDKEVVN